jgi:hypothetical protein
MGHSLILKVDDSTVSVEIYVFQDCQQNRSVCQLFTEENVCVNMYVLLEYSNCARLMLKTNCAFAFRS